MDILFSDLKQYGIYGVYLYILIKEVVPFIANRWFPERMKREQAKRSAEALVLKTEIEEREHRRKIEERSVAAMEKIGDGLIVITERMDQLSKMMTQHDTFTIEAVTDMRETVAKQKRDTKEKIKPVRKVKP